MDFTFDIPIAEENRNQIQNELDAVQAGCQFATINADRIFDAVHEIEAGFRRIPRNLWIEYSTEVDWCATEIKSILQHSPNSTHFSMNYENDGWHLVNIKRASIGSNRYDEIVPKELREERLRLLLEDASK